MARFKKPANAATFGIESTIIYNDPQTIVTFLEEISDTLSEIQEESSSVLDHKDVQRALRNLYERFWQFEIGNGQDNTEKSSNSSDETLSQNDDEASTINELSTEQIQASVNGATKAHDFAAVITWLAIGMLHRIAYKNGQLKTQQQILAVEVFHTLIDSLGLKYFGPRDDRSFYDYIDLAINSGLIKYSHWLAKEPVRAYRNAENSDRFLQINKVPSKNDPSKVVDYYSFIPEGGRATALKELRNLGIPETEFEDLVTTLSGLFKDEIDAAIANSMEVHRLIRW